MNKATDTEMDGYMDGLVRIGISMDGYLVTWCPPTPRTNSGDHEIV